MTLSLLRFLFVIIFSLIKPGRICSIFYCFDRLDMAIAWSFLILILILILLKTVLSSPYPCLKFIAGYSKSVNHLWFFRCYYFMRNHLYLINRSVCFLVIWWMFKSRNGKCPQLNVVDTYVFMFRKALVLWSLTQERSTICCPLV